MKNEYFTLTDTIYQRIKESIIKGRYKNDRLLLQNLANEMNVSVTPVREALKKLEKDELIKIIPNKGAVINKFTIKDVHEIYDIRLKLESLAVELLIENKDTKILEGLEKLLIMSENYLKNNNPASDAECCYKFHKLLIFGSNNKRLIKYYNELMGHLSVLMNRTAYFTNEPKRSSSEHRIIFEAIKQGKKGLAVKTLEKHIENAKKKILKRANKLFIKENKESETKSMKL